MAQTSKSWRLYSSHSFIKVQYWLDSAICLKMHNNLKSLNQLCTVLCKHKQLSKGSSVNVQSLMKAMFLYIF